MTSLIKFLAGLFDATFSPWFMAFLCVVLVAFTGGTLFSAFGG